MAKETLNIVVWSKQGCSYCGEVKQYLADKGITFKDIDLTNHDDRRDILEAKYGVRHVPVVEIGQGNQYEAVTDVGVQYIEEALRNK
ncbi:glutaredoxin family protein [Oceanobacillus neutriphilus]|uniref:Glutaredoxin YtnI n=1 Tax=Oceanobacillus neutriphilus TaxID=531815 RepID=A0ABQ2P0S8_9BACI|nr:glutaredoxin [Oceanobacillus neutriphilus]GGP15306.1 putative glutaredoxin YtnI [Oceanobacillus neutriphilus]